jgi:hypothetical protein
LSFSDFTSNASGGGAAAFATSYAISPIVLVGGVAGTSPGTLPIVSLLNAQNYNLGLLSASDLSSLSDYFATFRVVPGGSLIDEAIATWPFANMTVAANATISQPLKVSLEMIAPAKGGVSFSAKQSIMTALRGTLQQHIDLGGYFNVATLAYLYQDLLLTNLHDVTDREGPGQDQVIWQWDFYQPLITSQAAQGAQNQLMAKTTAGLPITGNPPGSNPVQTAVGGQNSNLNPNLAPAAANPSASSLVPFQPGALPAGLSAVSPILPGT